jgi:hypothetical protein
MTQEEMYKAILENKISLKQFEEWLSDLRHDAYCQGRDDSDYSHEMDE